jgi:hypothetical protein
MIFLCAGQKYVVKDVHCAFIRGLLPRISPIKLLFSYPCGPSISYCLLLLTAIYVFSLYPLCLFVSVTLIHSFFPCVHLASWLCHVEALRRCVVYQHSL